MDRIGPGSPGQGILAFLFYDAEEELQKKTLSKAGRAKVEKALDEARALLKEMGKTAASSGRVMKKAKAPPKPKSK